MREDYLLNQYQIDVARNPETGLAHAMVVRLNGKLQSPPDDRPAKVLFDDRGRIEEMWWFEQNIPSRRTGPAIVKLNPDNGVIFYEEWRGLSGELHRSHSEPAWTARDPITGEIQYSRFFVDGKEVPPPFNPKLDVEP